MFTTFSDFNVAGGIKKSGFILEGLSRKRTKGDATDVNVNNLATNLSIHLQGIRTTNIKNTRLNVVNFMILQMHNLFFLRTG